MKKIVIIGASDFQNPLILKAKEMGYETHVFAWECGDIGETTADCFYPIDIREKEQILQKCRDINPVGICSIASDLAVSTVNFVARALGLTANSERSDRVATNKYEMRKALEQAGIRTPKYVRATGPEEEIIRQIRTLSYPIIVKPTDRSGSRAVTRLESEDGLQDAIQAAIAQSFEHAAIAEEFLEGKEYSCECISYAGKHQLLAVTEKFTTGEPHYIEIGHIEPAPVSAALQEQIEPEVFRALDALDIRYGASHSEFMVDKAGKIAFVEIGARMGGGCVGSDLVQLATGRDYLKMVLDAACGRESEVADCSGSRYAAVRFVMEEEDLSLLETAKENFQIARVSEMDEDRTQPVMDESERHGYFIVTDPDYNRIKELLFKKTDAHKEM